MFDGCAAAFNNRDKGGDILHNQSLNDFHQLWSHIPILDSHDPVRRIGKLTSYSINTHGLYISGIIDTREEFYASLLETGALFALSIGYKVLDSRTIKLNNTRILRDISIAEISVTGFPMNPLTKITNWKIENHIDTKKEVMV